MASRIREVEATVSPEVLDRLRRPRSGLVHETAAGEDRYVGESALFDGYTRTIEVLGRPDPVKRSGEVDATEVLIRQRVVFRTAIPFFGWLFAWPLGSRLSRLGDPSGRVWWLPPDRLDRQGVEAVTTLAVLSGLLAYLSYLLSQTLTYAADEFGSGRGAQGVALAAVRLDIIPALVVSALADRRGRRRIIEIGLIGSAVLTALGALSPNLATLTASQVLSRGLLTAASISIVILAAEEVPAGSRAFAVSVLTAAGSLGGGVCLALLPLADLSIWAWRLLFAVGIVVWPLTRRAIRLLPESRRFVAAHPNAGLAGHGRRLWLLGFTSLFLAVFFTPASQFLNEYLRTERDFSGFGLLVFNTATNLPGAIGIVVGGRLADLHGRRRVGAIAVAGGVALTVVAYLTGGWTIWLASAASSLIGAAAIPALAVYGPELFPTGARGRANGVIAAMGRAGSILGLLLVGRLASGTTALGPAMAVAAIGPAVVVLMVLVLYPETAGRELEELNPEDA